MAVTISKYNHTLKLLFNGEVDFAAMKVILLNNSATFDATHTATTSVTNTGAYEVSGNGWDAGGELLASVAVTTVATSGAMLDCADLSVSASGGDIGPAYKAVITDATSGKPLFWVDFGEAKTAGDGTPFAVNINASGLARVAWSA